MNMMMMMIMLMMMMMKNKQLNFKVDLFKPCLPDMRLKFRLN